MILRGFRRLDEDESGVALIFAMLAAIILAGLATVFVANSVAQSRASYGEQNLEDALHIAEAGAEVALSRLDSDSEYATSGSTVSGDEETWVMDQWTADGGCTNPTMLDTADGPAYHVVPDHDVTGEIIVYGVGFANECDPDEARIVRMQFEFEAGTELGGNKALLSAGDIHLEQNARIDGGVHANGTLTLDQNPQFNPPATAGACAGAGSSSTTCTGGGEPERVPQFRARDFWDLRNDERVTIAGLWYELCGENSGRPGQILIRALDAGNTQSSPSIAPCSTATLSGDPAPTTLTSPSSAGWPPGWTYDSSTNTWFHSGPDMQDGVYYSYRSNINIADSPQHGTVSFFAEADVDNHLATNQGSRSGNIRVQKNPKFKPSWPGVGEVADVDIVVDRNGAYDGEQTLIYAHEQIRWAQNHKTTGVFFIACDESLNSQFSRFNPNPGGDCPEPDEEAGNPTFYQDNTPNSPVTTSTIAIQNIEISFDDSGFTLVPGAGEIVLLGWEEF